MPSPTASDFESAPASPTPSTRRTAVAFAVATFTFLLMDSVWLSTMAAQLYRPAIGHLMREDFDVVAALAFYVVYLSGIVGFAVRGAPDARGAFLRGGALGFLCYATYDLTNQATLAGWPWHVTLLDLAWGSFVTSVSAWSAHRVAHRRA